METETLAPRGCSDDFVDAKLPPCFVVVNKFRAATSQVIEERSAATQRCTQPASCQYVSSFSIGSGQVSM